MSARRGPAGNLAAIVRRGSVGMLLIAGVTVPAACGGEDLAPFAFPNVSSDVLGAEPRVVSNTAPPNETKVQVLREGSGRAVASGDVLVTNVKSQVWNDDGVELRPYLNTFSGGTLLVRQLEGIVPGWGKTLPGMKVGSRVVLVTPPEDGFGKAGNPSVGVTADDTLIFVIDILDAVPVDAMANGSPAGGTAGAQLPVVGPGKDPSITVPKGAPPSKLVERVLLTGTGDRIEAGQQILAQYTGVLWRDGKAFDSSWDVGHGPFEARVAESDPTTGRPGVIKGWVDGLVGQRVGSRVLLVVPPKLGYGPGGNSAAGITGADTLVFVIDILGVYGEPG